MGDMQRLPAKTASEDQACAAQQISQAPGPPRRAPSSRPRATIWAIAAALWLIGVIAGLRALSVYSAAPGRSADTTPRLPTDASLIIPVKARATLVMLVHPHCPCSRSSLRQLAEIMARYAGRVEANVLFLRPTGFAAGWERGDLWDAAAAIP